VRTRGLGLATALPPGSGATPPGRVILRLPPCSEGGLGSRIVSPWSIVPVAVRKRDIAADLPEAGLALGDLLGDNARRGLDAAAGSGKRPARGHWRRRRPLTSAQLQERVNHGFNATL
jgi:hypothetical protein